MAKLLSLAPSRAHIWAKEGGCTASPRMTHEHRHDEKRDMSAAEEGNAAHELAKTLIDIPETLPVDVIGKPAANGIIFNLEMWDAAMKYAEVVLDDAVKGTEQRLDVVSVHSECSVVVDAWAFDEVDDCLTIYDFKYGRSPVEVVMNPQCILGAIAVMEHYPIFPKFVRLCVVQPRGHHHAGAVRWWSMTMEEVRAECDRMSKAADEVYSLNAVCRTGRHCRNCDAMLNCPAHRSAIASCVDYTGAPVKLVMSTDELGSELSLLKRASSMLVSRITGVETELATRLKHGETTGSNWTLTQGRCNLKWVDDVETLLMKAKAMGVNIERPVDVITPTQAKDRKIISEAVLESLAHRPSAGVKLVETDINEGKRLFKS